jgi:hypothetical protein
MLRSAMLAAVFLLPSAAFADKFVNADGDSYVEIETQANSIPEWGGALRAQAPSFLETLNPIGSAQAQEAPRLETRPAIEVPEMRDYRELDDLLKPDYSAESFKMAQADIPAPLAVLSDALSKASPTFSANAAPRLEIPTAPLTYDIGNEFDGYYSKVPGQE